MDECIARITPYTLVGHARLERMWSLASSVRDLPGDALEVGVWRGGVSRLIAEASGKMIWAADTFSGVVKAGEHDTTYHGGEHADTSRSIAESILNGCDYRILEGVYPDEVRVTCPLAFVHIDVDVHDSARDVFEQVWPLVVPGGIVVFDDCHNPHTPGIKRFVDTLQGVQTLHDDAEGQAYVVKC